MRRPSAIGVLFCGCVFVYWNCRVCVDLRIPVDFVERSPISRSDQSELRRSRCEGPESAETRLTGVPGRNGLVPPVGVGSELAGPAQKAGYATGILDSGPEGEAV